MLVSLCLTCDSYEDHLDKLEELSQRLYVAGLKVNASKCVFCADQIEYLGFHITRDGIKPLDEKVQAIINLDRPKTLRDVRRILDMVQYYRDLWGKRSHVLAPLSDLVGELTPKTDKKGKRKKSTKKFIWNDEHEKAFKHMKKIVSREV